MQFNRYLDIFHDEDTNNKSDGNKDCIQSKKTDKLANNIDIDACSKDIIKADKTWNC